MKKIAVLILVFSAVTLTHARIGLGIDVWYSLNVQIRQEEDTANSDYDEKETMTGNSLNLLPRLVIKPSEKLEISPFILFRHTSSKEKTELNSETLENKRNQFSIGAGLGAFFHLIRGDIINLSLGPEISYANNFKPIYDGNYTDYDSYFSMNVTIGAPLNIDFHCNDHFNLRLSSAIMEFMYSIYKYERAGTVYSNNWFDFDIYSILRPSFGLFIMF